MFQAALLNKLFVSQSSRKLFSTSCSHKTKVAVLGGCGGIGQPLSLLLKMNPLITELAVQDLAKHVPGVAKDISHIEYPARVTGHQGDEGLKEALKCANIVVVPAGIPRKPGMNRDDLFDSNAELIKNVACAMSAVCPKAMLLIVTNPVNSVVPIACETLRSTGKLDPKRVFGITTLDNVRAATFIAEKLRVSPRDVNVPVIGGHSGITIIPVFSKTYPKLNFPLEEIKELTKRVQDAGTEVVKAKAGAGSATLSMAYSAARFVNSLLRAMKGESNIVECAYVHTDVCPAIPYFAGPVVLGKGGYEKMCPIGELNDFESEQLSKAIPVLQKEIQKGIDFVKCKIKENEKKDCEKSCDQPGGSSNGADKCSSSSTDTKNKDSKKQGGGTDEGCGADKKKSDPCAPSDKKGKDSKKQGGGADGGSGADKKKSDPCAPSDKKGKDSKKQGGGADEGCGADKKKSDPCAPSDKKGKDSKKQGGGADGGSGADKKKSDPCAPSDKKSKDSKKQGGGADGICGTDSKKSDPCGKK